MPNYQEGKIYMIWAGEDRYYGSTTQPLSKRMVEHRCSKNKNKGKSCSSILFEKHGIENCRIELVELYPCNSIEELRKREGEYIRENDCINKKIAGRTTKEYYYDNRENQLKQSKERYVKSKEKLTEKHICGCGGAYTTKNIRTHERTKKHQKYIHNATV